jgi:ATP-dependent Lhr-like helicase
MSLPLRRAAEATLLYEYSPTPSGVSAAVERSLVGEDMLPPSPERLKLLSEAAPAPENEERLHTRLMIEGDAVAGELDAPGNWFERLSRAGRAKYIEPGLWIAAEHAEDYAAALERGGNAARENIVRRLLRYRGAQTAQTVAERYFWRVSEAESVLTALVSQKNAVLSGEAYYHAELYDRARRETVKDRRRAVVTRPPEAYAALLSGGLRAAAPPEEQLLLAVNALRDEAYPAELWENVLLPARVRGYRPAMLDTLLTKGEVFWHMSPDGAVRFRLYEDIDWDAALPEWVFSDGARAVQKKPLGELPDGALAVYGALARRGASFAHALPLTPGADTLAELVKAGLIRADSFAPVRQLLSAEKTAKLPDRRRRAARALSAAGRWEITRPLRESAVEQQIDRAFDRAILLCRETVRGVNWSAALEQLRMWEFTGRVRRGYFIEGLSGAQFIRERDYAGASLAMDNPRDEIVWLNAADPLQPWGRSLAHRPERAFILVPGTVVALHRGAPVAVFERRGGTLRVFDGDVLPEALRAFARAFTLGHSFPQLKRVTVKDYPPDAADALAAAGFQPQMRDFALFRGVV